MKRKVEIVLFEEHASCNFYSLRIDDGDCETTKFFESMIAMGDRKEMSILSKHLELIGQRGAEERYLRRAGKIRDNVWELPDHYLNRSAYRLYCIRYGSAILVLGNGGKKQTRTYQEDSHLNSCVETLQELDAEIMDKIRRGVTSIKGKTIDGLLMFNI